MTNDKKVTDDLIYLCSCAFNGLIPDRERTAAMDLDVLYYAAKRHSLSSLTAYALETAGVSTADFTEARAKAMRKTAVMDTDTNALLTQMEESGIWYLPLKGAVIKDLYPAYGTREMADVDILFDPAGEKTVRDILLKMGYNVLRFGNRVHDIYVKEPVCHFEMHRQLFGSLTGRFYEYYKDADRRLIKAEGSRYGRRFTTEDLYVFLNAHEYKHYQKGGTGLRSLADIYVFLRKYGADLDRKYVDRELEQLGIRAFEENSRTLATDLFSGKTITDEEQAMLDYYISSGTYGSKSNDVKNGVLSRGGGLKGKVGYFLYRAFMPSEEIKESFPFVYRTKVLIPFLPMYRLVRGVLFRRRRMGEELKALFGRDNGKKQPTRRQK